MCQSDGCKPKGYDDDSPYNSDDILVIKRTQQTMRAVDQRSGAER